MAIALVAAAPTLRADDLLKRHNSRPLQAEADLSALEPWETPVTGFFIRNHHEVPVVDPDSFTLIVDGLVEKPLKLTLKDLKDYPETSFHAVLECAGNGRSLHRPKPGGIQWERGAIANGEWTGVRVADVLAAAKPASLAKFGRVEGADRPALPSVPLFARSIPIEKLRDPRTILATKLNREPMPFLHGGPLRLILPDWYGQNWIKWVIRITLAESEDQGFFMKKGYRMPRTPVKPGEKWDSATGAPIQQLLVQSFVVSPKPEESVAAGTIAVAGKAFSGAGTITKVELSTDGGRRWRPAQLEAPHADGGWQEFRASVEWKKLGRLTVTTRATDTAGNVQPLTPQWNPSGYLRNWADQVTLHVTKSAPAIAGRELVRDRCLACHAMEMITSQRLARDGWEKVVTKMEAFGVVLTKDEHAKVVDWVARYSPEVPPAAPTWTDYAVESERFAPSASGRASRGAELYAAMCASCHGDKAQGKTAPRLRGRTVTAGGFWGSVLYGRGEMPAFTGSITKSDIADLRGFLNRPEESP